MSFLPELHELHLFSVTDSAEILPQNPSLGHAVSSLALTSSLSWLCTSVTCLVCTVPAKLQCRGTGDVGWEKEVASPKQERKAESRGAFDTL